MTANEIEAIKRVVATVQHAQQNELVEEFVGLFHEDAIWTTAHGKVLHRPRRHRGVHPQGAARGAMTDSTRPPTRSCMCSSSGPTWPR